MPTALSIRPLFLQAAEATKAIVEATGKVTAHASQQGGNADVYWWLALVFFVAAALFAVLLYRSETGKAAVLQAARAEWAKEMAINNAAAEALQKQLREQYEKQVTQLRDEKKELAQQIIDANKELRLQVAKDAQVFEALTNSQRITSRTLQANNANQAEIMRVLGVAHPEAQIRPPQVIDLT